jgi:putative flavoprotein involved in K+ transport
MAWHLRWTRGSFGELPQSAAVSRPGRVDCWRGTEIAVDLAEGGAARVRIAVRTPPNILRRDVKGFPIQLLGIVFRRLPPRLLDPLILVLERATIPDLSACGLPRPRAPFSQFRRTRTVPIFDIGFIDAVRRGVIEVVPGVTALDGAAVVLADGSRVFPDTIVAATGYHPGLEPLVGHLTVIGEHGIPSPQTRLHFVGMRIPISGFLHEVGTDARRVARDVARELGATKPYRTAIAK